MRAESISLLLGANSTATNEATSTSPAHEDGTDAADLPPKDARRFERSRNLARAGVVMAALLVLMACATTVRSALLSADTSPLGQSANAGGQRDGEQGSGVLGASKSADAPRVLVAIVTHRGDGRRFARLEGTWLRNLRPPQAFAEDAKIDYYAFVGKPNVKKGQQPDEKKGGKRARGEDGRGEEREEVEEADLLVPSTERKVVGLDVGDAYEDLPAKVLAAFRWAREQGDYDYVFKADSDVYINPPQFARSLSAWHAAGYDWVGQVGLVHKVTPPGGGDMLPSPESDGGGTFEIVFDPTWHFGKCQDPRLNTQPYEGVLPVSTDGSRGYLLSRTALAALGRFERRRDSWLKKYASRNLYEDLLVSYALHEEGILLRDYSGWSLVGKGYDVKHIRKFLHDTRAHGELDQLVKMRKGGGVPAVVPVSPGTTEAGVLKCALIPGVCPKLDLNKIGSGVFSDPELPLMVQLHRALEAAAPEKAEVLREGMMATVRQRRAEREVFLVRAKERGLGTKRDPAIPHLGKLKQSGLGEGGARSEQGEGGLELHVRGGTEAMGYV